jgi:hypothetical protein
MKYGSWSYFHWAEFQSGKSFNSVYPFGQNLFQTDDDLKNPNGLKLGQIQGKQSTQKL